MLVYIARPSSTAVTMVVKLSSAKTIFDASLATSVPVIPIATPISAYCNAGASFTPSPVIATTYFYDFKSFTSSLLCRGSVREKTKPDGVLITYYKAFNYYCSLSY